MPKVEMEKRIRYIRFGDKLREIRDGAGITREEIAGPSVCVKTIVNAEAGGNSRLSTVVHIIDALDIRCSPDCPFRQLMTNEDEKGLEATQPDAPLK